MSNTPDLHSLNLIAAEGMGWTIYESTPKGRVDIQAYPCLIIHPWSTMRPTFYRTYLAWRDCVDEHWNPAGDLNQAFEVWRKAYSDTSTALAISEEPSVIRKLGGIRNRLRDAWDHAKNSATPQEAALALTQAATAALTALKEGV